MIDPIVQVAFSMHSSKGIYALLLGSGISRAAGIPTGYEILSDLITKLASANGESCTDPITWYKTKFGTEPDYSSLLSALCNSREDRSAILKSYFEPNSEEAERSEKTPTEAHRSIAQLVKDGYVKVVVTTNFDRLLEQALSDVGIVPHVVFNEDSAQGSLPVVHTTCFLLKLNGDYLDTRIRNTVEELSGYEEQVERLLDKILDEYGLVICGWSGEWDGGLRKAMLRCSTRRFSTFWVSPSAPRQRARQLVDNRSAVVIPGVTADHFFARLREAISGLEMAAQPHPLSARMASSLLKKYLSTEKFRIRRHDLVMDEAKRAASDMGEILSGIGTMEFNMQNIESIIQSCNGSTEIITEMFATGCHWSENEQEQLWPKALERLVKVEQPRDGVRIGWDGFNLDGAARAGYAGGIAALAGGRYRTLYRLLTSPIVRDRNRRRSLVEVMQQCLGGVADLTSHQAPRSYTLFSSVREALREYVDAETYEELFHRYEVLQALAFGEGSEFWGNAPKGFFTFDDPDDDEECQAVQMSKELDLAGGDWPPLAGGFAGGRRARARELMDGLLDYMRKRTRRF